MNGKTIEQSFREKAGQAIRLLQEGVDRYRVFTPFRFDDGDHFAIVMKKISGQWMLTDEGHTFMHLSYDMDLKNLEGGTRSKILSSTLASFNLREEKGALLAPLPDDGEMAGNVFYNYLQGLCKITDLAFLTRERVKSTFMDDFFQFIGNIIPADRLTRDYHVERDTEEKYPIDCKINGIAKPAFLYGIGSDAKCRDATIYLHQFEKWEEPHHPIAVFEDQERIGRAVLARFSDVCGKQFSNLGMNKDRIAKFFDGLLAAD